MAEHPTYTDKARIVNDIMTVVWYENHNAENAAVPTLIEEAAWMALNMLDALTHFKKAMHDEE